MSSLQSFALSGALKVMPIVSEGSEKPPLAYLGAVQTHLGHDLPVKRYICVCFEKHIIRNLELFSDGNYVRIKQYGKDINVHYAGLWIPRGYPRSPYWRNKRHERNTAQGQARWTICADSDHLFSSLTIM